MRRSYTTLAALATMVAGIAAFLSADILRADERHLTFETPSQDTGPFEAINGVPFPYSGGHLVITEALAHVRVPLQRTLLGKRLRVRARFHLDEADVLEVGVKKSSFWLDYDRLPLQHRVLDELLSRAPTLWHSLRSGDRVLYLNPKYQNSWNSVEEFEAVPPTDGPVGLYGNAVLPTPNAQRPTPALRPFRVDDDPDTFRAIYAWYPEPSRAAPEWIANEQRFDLSRAYQNEDGSIEVMFFTQRRGQQPIRLLLDELTLRIEPGWPTPKDLLTLARRNLVKLLRRPPAKL